MYISAPPFSGLRHKNKKEYWNAQADAALFRAKIKVTQIALRYTET